MLPHRSVLFYSDVGEKYALLLSYMYADKKNTQQFNTFSCKGNTGFEKLNLCFYAQY